MPTLGLLAVVFLLGFGLSQAVLTSFPQANSADANLTEYQFETTKPDTLSAIAAYVVMDEATGEVLLSQNEATLLPTASVAKLLVAGVALGNADLSATTTITAGDVATEEDFGRLAAVEVYTIRELLVP